MTQISYSRTNGAGILGTTWKHGSAYLLAQGLAKVDDLLSSDRERPTEAPGQKAKTMAHPMLQPVNWGLPPEKLRSFVETDRLALYTVIWDSALACLMKPREAHIHRLVTKMAGADLVLAAVSFPGGSKGSRSFRLDYPRFDFPTIDVELFGQVKAAPIRNMRAKAVRVPSPTLGDVILSMQNKRLSTPSSVARLLREVTNESGRSNPIKLEEEGGRMRVRLTEHGSRNLDKWRLFGMTGQSYGMDRSLTRIQNGEETLRQAFAAVFPFAEFTSLDKIIDQIEQAAHQWAEMGKVPRSSASKNTCGSDPTVASADRPRLRTGCG